MKNRVAKRTLAIVAMSVPFIMLAGCAAAPDQSGASGGKVGGTLRVAGNADVLYMDPAASYSAQDSQLHRLMTRSLFADLPDGDTGASKIVPDLALEIPTV